jgi:conjugal transfer/type IV secretion protein DotA/TraY
LYSGAMLIFAAIILFYHLASMVVDTAHSGVTMGKRANQVWAPIRLVAAVILLVPIAGGLNTGQLIVLKMAQWGSGLASNVWDTFKVQLAAGVNGNYASPAVPDVSDTVTNIAKMAACEYRYNYGTYQAFLADPTLTNPVGGVNPNPDEFVSGWSNSWAVGNAWNFNCDPIVPGDNSGACNNNSIGAPLQDIGASNPPLIEVTPAGTVYHFQPPRPDPTQQDICGSITIPVAPSANDITTNNLMNSVYTAQIAAFNAVLPAIMHYGSNEQQYLEGTGNAPTQGNINPDLSGQSIMNIIATYQGNLNAQIAAQVGAQAGMTDKYLGVGWMGAGAFFNQVSNIQAAIQSSSDHYIPATTPPTGDIDISDFNADLTQSIKKQSLAALPPVALPGGGGCAAGAVNNEQSFLDILKKSNGSLFDFLLDVVNLGAANTGVWCQDGTIGIRFTGSAPLNQMAAWGHQNIDLAVDIINWGGWFMVAGATASSGIIGRVVTAISAVAAGIGKVLAKFHMGSSDPSTQSQQIDSNMNAPMYANIIATANPGLASVLGEFLLPFAAIFLTLGFMFGYMLPILPFMHFLFGSVTWLTVLFEAVVAMPLVALAHINPEGEGLPGAMARNAYFMAFSILLRPVCMIFGLICGFITLMLATSLLNIFFAHAMTGNTAEGHHALVKIVYTIIYCIILISIANHAFQLISVIPDKIMSWIGAAGAKGERMGDPANIVDRSAATAAILDSKGVQQMGAMGRQARQAAVTSQQTAKSDAAAAGQRALAVDTALSARQTAANTASINSKTPP